MVGKFLWAFGLVVVGAFSQAQGANYFSEALASDFININKENKLFVRYKLPSPGYPTLVLLNDLTGDTTQWQNFIDDFGPKNPNFGILTYDMMGMGQTLLMYREAFIPNSVYSKPEWRIEYENQAHDLKSLLNGLNISGDLHLIGDVYGAAIAQVFTSLYGPQLNIESLILQAPYVQPLTEQRQSYNNSMNEVRKIQRYFGNEVREGDLPDFFVHEYVYKVFPDLHPEVPSHSREGIYRMLLGLQYYSAQNYFGDLPEKSVHLLLPLANEQTPISVYEKFWQDLPESSRGSRLLLPESTENSSSLSTWLNNHLCVKKLLENQ